MHGLKIRAYCNAITTTIGACTALDCEALTKCVSI